LFGSLKSGGSTSFSQRAEFFILNAKDDKNLSDIL